MASITDVKAFLASLDALGVQAPAELAGIPAVFDALMLAKGAYGNASAALVAAYNDGTLTPDTAAAKLGEVARSAGEAVAANDAIRALDGPMSADFSAHLRGHAGDQLTAALREVFDPAVAGIIAAADVLPNGVDAAQVLELDDPRAATAWRELPGHVQALDQIYNHVVRPMVYVFDCKAERPFDDQRVPAIAFLIDPHAASANLLDAAAEIGGHPAIYSRGGRWSALMQAGFALRLNTPSEAIALTEDYYAGRDEADAILRQGMLEEQRPFARRGAG